MSEIKVNKISPRTACGTTTLGDSGDTFTIPAGVTITNSGTAAGFGATGAVSWDTTAKTTGFTAVDGVGYFVNTTAGAITVTLPLSPAAGAVIGVSDYAGTADTNNITIGRNGSNINGAAADQLISIENSAVTLVYVDGTQGWKATDTSSLGDIALQPTYITATGGTITTVCTDYKVHTFTGPGTFCVSNAGNPVGSDTVDYLVVAGGGSGGGVAGNAGGGTSGGGAGGTRYSDGTASGCYAAGPSPLSASALTVSVTAFPIIVGGGGAASPALGASGNTSTFSTISSTGGGGGAAWSSPTGYNGVAGGSGGGGAFIGSSGAGNTPPVSPPQGNPGGTGSPADAQGAGGGGGTTAAGGNGTVNCGGDGGAGITNAIRAACESYGGGGGGGLGNYPAVSPKTPGSGGIGGGATALIDGNGVAATVNTGGGGSGTQNIGSPSPCRSGGAGGSGIVIIRYKFQN